MCKNLSFRQMCQCYQIHILWCCFHQFSTEFSLRNRAFVCFTRPAQNVLIIFAPTPIPPASQLQKKNDCVPYSACMQTRIRLPENVTALSLNGSLSLRIVNGQLKQIQSILQLLPAPAGSRHCLHLCNDALSEMISARGAQSVMHHFWHKPVSC